jgi:NADPH:quinone reductase-like Zn-dependent oxidoreductase
LVTAAQIGPGVRVLIHAAAGGVGTFAVQIARNRGAHVAATCSRGNIDFVCGLVAEEVITYDDKIAFEDKLSRLDVVLDPIGGEVHRRSYAVLRKGCMLVCLSAAPYQDRGDEYGVTVRLAQVAPDPTVLAALLALVPRVRPIVERILPFSDFVAAQRASQQGHARGKTVLRIR